MNGRMEFEKLAIQVSATNAGLKPVTPPMLKGESGVVHRFTLLFSDSGSSYALDFYEKVTEVEVIRSYVKGFDTKASVAVVCLSGNTTEEARTLARTYGVLILGPENTEGFFATEKAPSPRLAD
jgi:hypothetical protein